MERNEKVDETKNKLMKIFDGNWANDNMGQVEELQSTVSILQGALAFTLAILVEQDTITMDEIKEYIDTGWRMDYMDYD